MMNKRRIGSLYEEIASEYLINNGFSILENNYRCKIGEIDIIAYKDNIIRFIEIKYRKNTEYGYALESVSKHKQFKIMKTAQWYINEKHLGNDVNYSFDVIAIQGNDIQYLFNCFGAM